MTLLRRILILAALSATGIGLLAPLAARSATPTPLVVEEHLLSAGSPANASVERGSLSARAAAAPLPDPTGIETVHRDAGATPAAVPMEATLVTIATPRPVPAPARVVTYAGDSVWDDLARCESGGNWAINTGNGYYGGLQFSHDTWHAYGGGEFAEYPHLATREEQIAVAERLHAVRGFQPWPACRLKLGLP
jgi:hypothetical protein